MSRCRGQLLLCEWFFVNFSLASIPSLFVRRASSSDANKNFFRFGRWWLWKNGRMAQRHLVPPKYEKPCVQRIMKKSTIYLLSCPGGEASANPEFSYTFENWPHCKLVWNCCCPKKRRQDENLPIEPRIACGTNSWRWIFCVGSEIKIEFQNVGHCCQEAEVWRVRGTKWPKFYFSVQCYGSIRIGLVSHRGFTVWLVNVEIFKMTLIGQLIRERVVGWVTSVTLSLRFWIPNELPAVWKERRKNFACLERTPSFGYFDQKFFLLLETIRDSLCLTRSPDKT